MKFFLGSHMPHWLREVSVPMFISRRTLSKLKRLPQARCEWALDSGGFSELSMFGEWRTTAIQYLAEVRRFRDEVGKLEWAAVQDWMCEPAILARTKLSIADHQERTIDSFLTLTSAMPEMQWVPVLQGWRERDYWDHCERYARRGVALDRMPTVGVGSICRRQSTREAAQIIRGLSNAKLRIHGFGFKQKGLAACRNHLVSSDSLAWSFNARRSPPLLGCAGHKNCANCLVFALRWRQKLLNEFSKRELEQ